MAMQCDILIWFILLSIFPGFYASDSKAYVVYMGSSGGSKKAERGEGAYLDLLSSVSRTTEGGKNAFPLHSFGHAFRGFSAMLEEEEASALSNRDEILSVFLDTKLPLHTTRSWDFLEDEYRRSSKPQQWNLPSSHSDAIIGVIDTGIWPESPSFKDDGIGSVPSRWKGVCMKGADFGPHKCNRKLIGARYYDDPMAADAHEYWNASKSSIRRGSARDRVGHGTHTTSIAAGDRVFNASYYGLGLGTARGGLPSARVAAYKACDVDGCLASTLLKAMDDAIGDGVDIISISVGMSAAFQSSFLMDPIAIGAFHAEQRGVLVVCSAGNDGPDPSSVVNSAPWILTVAASNIDRDFQSLLVLANGKSFRGSAITFSNLTKSDMYPLAFGKDVAAKLTPISDAKNCFPGSLDPSKAIGRIVVCIDGYPKISRGIKKFVAESVGARGLILINGNDTGWPFDAGSFPFAEVGNDDGLQILNYINSTNNPRATMLGATEVQKVKGAPLVAHFSSRGPSGLTQTLLKPDVMAPGVAILAATTPSMVEGTTLSTGFTLKSGTSMACPHVAGAAAFVKSVHQHWTPSMIRSALMTTATAVNDMGKPLTTSTGQTASPFDMGTGEINPIAALSPGLIFETKTEDYLRLLCYLGYPEKNIRSMANTSFVCPAPSSQSLITDVNYPSISIANLRPHKWISVTRTVTNVGSYNSTYFSSTYSPAGLNVNVWPETISFNQGSTATADLKITFSAKAAKAGYNFGYVIFSDHSHAVRLVFAVNVLG